MNNTVTVYTTMEETQQEILKSIGNKYYPSAKFEITADSVRTLSTRIRVDISNDADIIIGGLFSADGDLYHDILQKYTTVNLEKQAYVDTSGYYTFYDVQVMSMVVNPKFEKELGIEIKGSIDDFAPISGDWVLLFDFYHNLS